MEHLRSVFQEELADPESGIVLLTEGRVTIAGRSWKPGDLLEALGGDVYSQAFANWVTSRRQRLLERADDILTQFDQVDRFEALKETFGAGSVMPFVGAGMSIPSAYPGWTAFLQRVRRQTRITEEYLSELLNLGEYERAAQELADALGVAFDEQVDAAFGRKRELRGPVQLIPRVFDTAVATTNFDDVLSRCYVAGSRPFEQVVTGVDAEEIQRLLSAGRRVLVKLHGTATSGRGRILTAREYEAAYGGETISHVVRALCTRTLLFIGCRLTVDRLLTAIRAFVSAEGHRRIARHYAFLATGDDETERLARAAALYQLNIYPIWYPDGTDDESIEALLYRLGEGIVEWP